MINLIDLYNYIHGNISYNEFFNILCMETIGKDVLKRCEEAGLLEAIKGGLPRDSSM